jgi:hypothetical protein
MKMTVVCRCASDKQAVSAMRALSLWEWKRSGRSVKN